MKNLNASQVRLLVRLLAQLVAAITALAVSHPAWAGAVGTLTAIEGVLQWLVKNGDCDCGDGEAEQGGDN